MKGDRVEISQFGDTRERVFCVNVADPDRRDVSTDFTDGACFDNRGGVGLRRMAEGA